MYKYTVEIDIGKALLIKLGYPNLRLTCDGLAAMTCTISFSTQVQLTTAQKTTIQNLPFVVTLTEEMF